MRGGRVKRPTKQSLYKKARFVFGRDCRVALRAPRNDFGRCAPNRVAAELRRAELRRIFAANRMAEGGAFGMREESAGSSSVR
ncbi:MAG: hypothetical protein LBL66_08760 [Clostridiales bacterium]|nr:hypothetical protein [Clostridiales bacterium]